MGIKKTVGHSQRIIIDYHGSVIERCPKPGQIYGILYKTNGQQINTLNCRFFDTVAKRDKFVEIHEGFDPLLYVEL